MSLTFEQSSDMQTSFVTRAARSIARTFPEHIPLYVCAVVFGAITLCVVKVFHVPLELDAGSFFLGLVLKFVALGAACASLYEFTQLIRGGFPQSPTRIIASRLHGRFFSDDRIGNVFHSLIAFTPLMVSFAALKEVIPQVHPFVWDQTFMHWDRVIGFGRLPWEILQPVLGYPLITASLNFLYDSWFLIMFGGLFWQAFSARGGEVRLQFLLAFSFAWFIAGNILATILSSAGPCFYGSLIHGSNPYAAQMAYLHATAAHWPVWSVGLQDLLWQSYVRGDGQLGGISAMPSMHVTSTGLLMFVAWRTNRRLGIVLTIFTALIVIGSVHLAWHYAVDGIAGLILATAFWLCAGAISRKWLRWIEARRATLPAAVGAVPV